MKREIFGSKLAVFFVMLGSISGASNVLGFSTITSQNGGLAFIIVHFVILFTLGFVLMTTELFIGRATKKDVVGALKTFTNKCYGSITGYLIIIISFLFLLYYSSVLILLFFK